MKNLIEELEHELRDLKEKISYHNKRICKRAMDFDKRKFAFSSLKSSVKRIEEHNSEIKMIEAVLTKARASQEMQEFSDFLQFALDFCVRNIKHPHSKECEKCCAEWIHDMVIKQTVKRLEKV